jgi:cytidylate kinase
MAENFLSKYLAASIDKKNSADDHKGLVITISRQKGCGAYPIANMLIDKMNALKYPYGKRVPWRLISKEIMEESASKLEMKPALIDPILDKYGKSVFNEIILSLTHQSLPSDIKIKNTIRSVIENAANEGNIIIIGRGGVSITRNFKNSLHIRLEAPLDWRIKAIARQNNISLPQAEKLVKERDMQRTALKLYFLGKPTTDHHIYDLVINVSTMERSEIAEAIFSIVKMRQDKLLSR